MAYQSDYEFDPKPPAKTLNPPELHHVFAARLNACFDPCNWLLPHDCMHPFPNTSTLQKIPKKRTKFDTESDDATRPLAWGLEAKYSLMFIYVFAYFVIMLVLSFAFWGWWLDSHPGDLQNAAVPVSIVVALFSGIWGIYAVTKSLDRTG